MLIRTVSILFFPIYFISQCEALSLDLNRATISKRNDDSYYSSAGAVQKELVGKTDIIISKDAGPSRQSKIADTPLADRTSIHLVSLPPLTETSSKIVRDTWKWKDTVLGNGRDYFVPRPRALKALSDIIVGSNHGNYIVEECAILSNCARLDILISLNTSKKTIHIGGTDTNTDENIMEEKNVAKKIISSCLNAQLASYQAQRRSKSGALFEGVSLFLDLPGMVDISAKVRDMDSLNSLESLLQSQNEIDAITRHFCLVAAGLAPRDSRPNRSVLFRPFSSRDAHIMLQLKRTVEVASIYPQVKIILDSALHAGKGARDPGQCPALLKLKGYDGEGKYSQAAPPKLAKEVAGDVMNTVIEPAVEQSIERIKAFQVSSIITTLRQQALELYNNGDVETEKKVRVLLHEPTMQLRKGCKVDVQQVLEIIGKELSHHEI